MGRLGPLVTRVFLFGFGFNWIHTRGRLASTKEAPILVVSPHSCLLDIFVISLYSRYPTFLARSDVKHIPLFGSMSHCQGSAPTATQPVFLLPLVERNVLKCYTVVIILGRTLSCIYTVYTQYMHAIASCHSNFVCGVLTVAWTHTYMYVM